MNDEQLPILTVRILARMEWQQHAPGGCRCVCAFYHKGGGACAEAAEPGLFANVINVNKLSPDKGEEELGTVVLCRGCYQAIAERASQSAR